MKMGVLLGGAFLAVGAPAAEAATCPQNVDSVTCPFLKSINGQVVQDTVVLWLNATAAGNTNGDRLGQRDELPAIQQHGAVHNGQGELRGKRQGLCTRRRVDQHGIFGFLHAQYDPSQHYVR